MEKNMAMLCCNVGWMESYSGIDGDSIVNGGEYINKHGIGGEIINFYPCDGKFYGYVRNKGNFNLKRFTSDKEIIKQGYIDGIDIIWVAKSDIGPVIVGWYKNARVYSQRQIINDLKLPIVSELIKDKETELALDKDDENDTNGYYRFIADQDNCILLPVEQRTFLFQRKGTGFMGQTPFWYADSEESREFVKNIKKYINSPHISINNLKEISKNSNFFRNSNVELRLKTEKAAIDFVWGYYTNLGYTLKSVEKDNVGWDLEAKKETEKLCIEVKGLYGIGKQIQLSPNEYKHFLKNEPDYRLCIVNDALSKTAPNLFICYYSKNKKSWLIEDKPTINVSWNEQVAAIVKLD